jgi:RNA polymerase sigma-70 factor (ECF subfamily)
MADSSFNTTHLQDWQGRMAGGDASARDELVRAARSRLETLARRMLRKYPTVARWADADDVFQAAVVRLLRSLEAEPVVDTRHFLNRAATHMRRELIDLARHFHGPHGVGANHDSLAVDGPAVTPAAPAADLDRWTALHTAIEGLPAAEREVFGLAFYHGWTQPRIAELFGVDVRTVGRRWRAACEQLGQLLGDGEATA